MSGWWIDSHAHLAMFEPGEVPAVLERARAAGVGGVLVPATGPDDLARTLELAGAHPYRVVGVVGVHPHEASALDAALKRRIERALAAPGIVGVGEIGLDYHYMNSPREDQLAALRWQLELATEAGLPVVLHNRESWEDLERALVAVRDGLVGVCHSFAEPPRAARRAVELGLVVGISGMVTFRRGDNVREMVRALLPGEVLVETDAPYLAPVPYRGRRNEPAWVVETARRVAAELEIGEEELRTVTGETFRRVFRLGVEWPQP